RQRAEPVRNRSGNGLRRCGRVGKTGQREFGKHDEIGILLCPGLARELRDPFEIFRDVSAWEKLRDAESRLPPVWPGLMPVEPEEIARVPAERVGQKLGVKLGPTLGKHGLTEDPARACRLEIDVGDDKAVTAVEHGRYPPVRRNHATAAAELHRAL